MGQWRRQQRPLQALEDGRRYQRKVFGEVTNPSCVVRDSVWAVLSAQGAQP